VAVHRRDSAVRTVARSRLALGRQLATTPGRLRLAAVLLALCGLAFGVVAAQAASERRHAVQRVATTEPLLVAAVKLSASLSNAHAVAALSFLRGRPERAAARRSYDDEIEQASVGVARLAREIGTSSSGSGPAVRRITQKLPVYAGLIENARANNRQGFPVGSAYLRKAALTMRNGMLPAARDLFKIEAQHLTASYRTGVSSWAVPAVALAGSAMLTLLAWIQLFLTRATRRIINPGLAIATVVLLGLMGWILAAFTVQRNGLAEAQREGSDPVELLTTTRILAFRAQADESIALAARGGGEAEPRLADVDRGFQAVTRPIRGLLDQAASISAGASDSIEAIDADYRRYLQAHSRVVEQVKRGDFSVAVRLAVERGADGRTSTSTAAKALDDGLDGAVGVAQSRFADAAAGARSSLAGLQGGIPALTALCVFLALFGVRQRLEEYR
jgi:hypothetical protein